MEQLLPKYVFFFLLTEPFSRCCSSFTQCFNIPPPRPQNEEPAFSRDCTTFFITVPLKQGDRGTFSHITMISNRVKLRQAFIKTSAFSVTVETKAVASACASLLSTFPYLLRRPIIQSAHIIPFWRGGGAVFPVPAENWGDIISNELTGALCGRCANFCRSYNGAEIRGEGVLKATRGHMICHLPLWRFVIFPPVSRRDGGAASATWPRGAGRSLGFWPTTRSRTPCKRSNAARSIVRRWLKSSVTSRYLFLLSFSYFLSTEQESTQRHLYR